MINFEYDKEMFIFPKILDVPNIGKVRFLSYREYLENMNELSMINMKVLHIYYAYKEMIKKVNVEKDLLESLELIKKETLFTVVRKQKEFSNAYLKVFSIVLDQNEEEHKMKTLEMLFDNEEAFEFMRRLVLDMQMLAEEEVAEDPKVQKHIEMSKRARKKNSGKQTLFDLASSIVVGTNASYEDIANMTVIQVYATYYRLGVFKAYDTSTLFASVGADAKHIEQWNKNIDLFEKQTAGMGASDFNKNFGGLFK